jgi:curved DNA-binding protein CbpA
MSFVFCCDKMKTVMEAYEVLGITPGSTKDESKKAYKKLALKYHPDKTNGDTTARLKFMNVQEAYETLTDPDNSTWIEVLQENKQEDEDDEKTMEQERQVEDRLKQELETAKKNLEKAKQGVDHERIAQEKHEQKMRQMAEKHEQEMKQMEQERQEKERKLEERQQRKRERDAQQKRDKRKQEREEREERERQEREWKQQQQQQQQQRKRKREDRDRKEREHPVLLQRIAELEDENVVLKDKIQKVGDVLGFIKPV